MADGGPQAVDGSLGGLAQQSLQLGEGVFDWIEVWAVGRKIENLCAGRHAIVAGVRANKRLIVIPLMMKVIYVQHALFPWVVQWLMTVTGYRPAPR